MADVVVVGGGQAGSSLVAKLRHAGFEGSIAMIGAEPVPPYQRPPLSKAYLLGEMELERLFLRPEHFYPDHDIDLHLGTTVDRIDRDAQAVQLSSGGSIHYGNLVLTTGSHPRRLPASIGADGLAGVHEVRTLADVEAMAPEMQAGKRALIVGGGYIGLEAAAVASKLGLKVTLVEMADRILERVACKETSDFFRTLHEGHGVDVREGNGLQRIEGKDGRVARALLACGTELDIDLVVVGVGILPGSELADEAGLMLDNGIGCDAHGRTSDPKIWAAGDCASFPWRGQRIRLESVQNAIEMAECVAENIMGANKEYDPHPWFWSDQYDVKLQIAGLARSYDRIVTRPGDHGHGSHWYYAGDQLVAVDALSEARAYMVGKRLIEAGRSPDPGRVADPGVEIKSLLKD